MQSATLVCALVVLASLCLQAQSNCVIFGEDLTVGVHYRNCSKIECLKNGDIRGVGCPPSTCSSATQTSTAQEFESPSSSKPYPQCCEQSICEKS